MDFRRPLHDIKSHWSTRTTRVLTILGKRSAMRAVRDGSIRIDLGAKYLWPEWKTMFRKEWLREDIVAALSVVCVAIPISFAIALASGVRPEVGLVSAIVGGIFCALFGGTSYAVSGPAAALAVLMAANVEKFGIEGVLFIGFLAGLMQLITGAFGLGGLARYVPAPVVAGFTAGIGAILFVGQLPRALGLPPPDQAHTLDVVAHLGNYIQHMDPMVFVLTLATMITMLGLPRVVPSLPAPLVAVLVTTGAVWAFGLQVPQLGDFPRTLPWPAIPKFPSDWAGIGEAAFVVFVIASLEAMLSSNALDRIAKEKRHDFNQELIGQGVGNIATSFFGGITVTGAITRSALNFHAGAKTRRAPIFHSIFILLCVFLLEPVMSHIPYAALAGVLLSFSLYMLDPREIRSIWDTSKADAFIYAVTLVLVVAADLVSGVQAGIGLAFLIAALRLGQTRIQVHRTTADGPHGFSLSGSLTFLSLAKLDWLQKRFETLPPGTGIVLDLSKVNHVDSSGVAGLLELVEKYREVGLKVVLKGLSPDIEGPLVAADEKGLITKDMAVSESEVLAKFGGSGKRAAARSRMLSGVERFHKEIKHHYEPLFEKLEIDQAPHTLFITCSDSRIVPHLFTSTEPGELFVVRNAGNCVPPLEKQDSVPAEGAAVEYAVGILGVSQIVVCGHSACGAIRATLANNPLTEFPQIKQWLESIKLGIADYRGSDINEAAKLNVLRQTEHLKTYPLVAKKVADGSLAICSWFFDVGSSEFFEYKEEKKEFISITSMAHNELEEKKALTRLKKTLVPSGSN